MPPVSRMSSSNYWIPPSRRQSSMNSALNSSLCSSDSSSSPRNYVDPWDLENYAYMKRHFSDMDDPVVSLSTNGLDSANSDFYYFSTGHNPSRRQRNPAIRRQSMILSQDEAGVEEEDFYNERYDVSGVKMSCCHQKVRRHSSMVPYTEYDDRNLQCAPFHPDLYGGSIIRGSCISPEVDCLPVSRSRRMSTCQREQPQLIYVYQTPRVNRKTSKHIREYRHIIANSDDYSGSDMRSGSEEDSIIVYDELVTRRHHIKPQHFGLSTFGHLKIDYSCNWSNLDRYIGHS